MFESILTNYPKRSDLWSVYLDMMIKQGDIEPVRYEKEPRFSHFMMNKFVVVLQRLPWDNLRVAA